MKSKTIMLFIAVITVISLVACGDAGGAMSVTEAADSAAQEQTVADAAKDASGDAAENVAGDSAEDSASEEDAFVIPEAVQNLTPEEDALLTGALKDNVYTNEYFGYRAGVPEGWALTSSNGEAEGEALKTLSQLYAEESCIFLHGGREDLNDHILVIVNALKEEDIGKTEEELIQDDYDMMTYLDESLDEEVTSHVGTVNVAGKDHPAVIDEYTSEDGTKSTTIDLIIPKGDFEYSISFFSQTVPIEDLLKCLEAI